MASPTQYVLGQLVEVSVVDGSWSLGSIAAIAENMVVIYGASGVQTIPKEDLTAKVRTRKGFTEHKGFIDGGDTWGNAGQGGIRVPRLAPGLGLHVSLV